MRVLMLSWEYPPNVVGGLGRHVAELAPALVQQGIELHLVTPTAQKPDRPVEVEHGVMVHRVFTPAVGSETIGIYNQVVDVNKILEAYVNETRAVYGPYELIHTHDWLTGFAAIALKKTWLSPLVTTIHATERGRGRGYITNHLQWLINNAERSLIDESWQVIVCSSAMFHEIQYFFQTAATKLDVVPNAVNLTDLRNGYNQQELQAFRARYAEPDDRIVFTIGRLVYEKGIHRLVQAAPRVLAECPQVRMIIAGRGPEAENLKQQAANLGVSDRVNFVGFISDEERNQLFKIAACAVFPSLYEPFGIVALEAMALGCPVIVSDVGGFSEVVTHTETGVTVYPDDAESVGWGILHTLTHPNWTQKHVIKARRSVEELFNWPRIAKLTLEVYQRVLTTQADHVANNSI